MKRSISLHEFMPYGAPDLIAAHRSHMSRALAMSSTLATAALFGFAALAPLFIAPPAPPPAIVIPPFHDVINAKVTELMSKVSSSRGAKVATGTFKPVPELRDAPISPDAPIDYDAMAKQLQPDGTTGIPNGIAIESAVGVDPDAPVDYVEVLPVAAVEVKPVYPEIAIQTQTEGLVIVLVLVGRDGRVRDAKVDERRHEPLLDEAALAAARQWVFSPALVGNHPVAVWTALPFRFKLH